MFWGEEAVLTNETYRGLMAGKGRGCFGIINEANLWLGSFNYLQTKQTDGMSHASDDDPVISRVTSWQVLSTLIGRACLFMNTENETHPCQRFHYLSDCSACSQSVPNKSQTLPYRAGNVKSTSEYQQEQRTRWTEATQWIEEVTHRN